MLVCINRLFADHFQFYIYDSAYDHYSDPRLSWKDANRQEFGYQSTDRAIYVSTVAHQNDHRLRVFKDEAPSRPYERIFSRVIDIQGQALCISAIGYVEDDNILVPLAPGRYRLDVCAQNLGKDELSVLPEHESLTDEEFFEREDIESYDLFIQPVTFL